jgi:hypothetical protein
MKKNRITRILKLAGYTIGVLFLAVFIWANWTGPTPGDRLKPKVFALYDLGNVQDKSVFGKLDAQLKNIHGVLATCVKPADKIISVVFYPDQVDRNDLMNKLSEWSNTQVTFKAIVAKGPTCPVAGVTGELSAIKRFLCVRS